MGESGSMVMDVGVYLRPGEDRDGLTLRIPPQLGPGRYLLGLRVRADRFGGKPGRGRPQALALTAEFTVPAG